MSSVPDGNNGVYDHLSMKNNKTVNSFYMAVGYERDRNIYVATELQYLFSRNCKYHFYPQDAHRSSRSAAVEQSLAYGDDITLLMKIGKTCGLLTSYAIAGLHVVSITHKVEYPYVASAGSLSVYNATFKKNACGFVFGGGLKYKTKREISVGAEVICKFLPNTRFNTSAAYGKTPTADLDEDGFNRTYSTNNPARLHFCVYATTPLILF